MTIAVLPESLRAALEPRLPAWMDARWWADIAQMHQLAPQAEIGWFDLHVKPPAQRAVELAQGLRWLNCGYAGVDWLPLAQLDQRGVALTCGAGLTAIQVAEFAVMGMLTIAKDYRAVVRAQDRHEWLAAAPGTRELAGSRALLLGYGAIGQAIARMLGGFGVDVVPVRSRAGAGVLGPDQWRAELGSFDWIILALPGTPDTAGIIGAAELAALRPDAVLINFARADCLDQPALVECLQHGRIAGAMLDLTDPEPLPADHVLWSLPNAHITMHLSGIPTPASRQRAVDRFIRNCDAFHQGVMMEAQVDLLRGY